MVVVFRLTGIGRTKFKPDLEDPFEVMRGIRRADRRRRARPFPKLRGTFLKAGVGWLPFWMGRLDEHYFFDARIRSVPAAQASDVIRSENFFISCDPNGETLPLVTNFAGGDHILHASDYPHFDGRFPDTVKLTERPEVFPPEVQRKIL